MKSILIIWKIVIRLKNRVEKYCSQQCIKIIAVSSLKQNEIYKSNDSNKWNGKCIKIRYYSYTRPLAVIKKSPHSFNNLTQQNLTNVTTFRIQRKTELNSRRVG